jgi:hypothetical protein
VTLVQAYRAMDLMVEAEVQEAVFFAVTNLLNLEVDLLFFDSTCLCSWWVAPHAPHPVRQRPGHPSPVTRHLRSSRPPVSPVAGSPVPGSRAALVFTASRGGRP